MPRLAGLAQLAHLKRYGHRANVVPTEQEAVAGFLTHSLGNVLQVCHCEIVLYHLHYCTGSELLWSFPVILVIKVFNRHHWVVSDERLDNFSGVTYLLESSGNLKFRSYVPHLKNSGGSQVHANNKLICVASCYPRCILQQLQGFFIL